MTLFELAPAPTPPATVKASQLHVDRCSPAIARQFIKDHHSRLPVTQRGPWMHAYKAVDPNTDRIFATALWNNPSARTLPNYWIELRRMAVSADAPHCTASAFLAKMVKDLRLDGKTHFISYQDCDVHTGTIYKAAGWQIEHSSQPRTRERGYSAARGRNYRTSINGQSADSAAKNRWAICYGCDYCDGVEPQEPKFQQGQLPGSFKMS